MKLRNIINLILISFFVFCAGISLSLISPFYPSEALSKGVSVTESGLVMGSVFITTIIFTPIFGKYMDLVGAKKMLILGSFIVGIGNLMFGFLSRIQDKNTFFGLSILLRFIIAIGESAISPPAYPLAGKQVSKENQGKTIAAVECFFGVGTMFGPSVGGYLYDLGGFSLPFWISGFIMIFISSISICLLTDILNQDDNFKKQSRVSWFEIFSAPGVLLSCFALVFAGASWAWYQASLEPFLKTTYGLSSSQTGLVMLTFGLTYTVFTPIFGLLTDFGLDGLFTIFIGNSLIAVGFMFLGPIPPLQSIGYNLWLTVLSLGLQGLGSAATYLGTLLYMMKSIHEHGLPDTEQTHGMVSSLWVVADCVGGFMGSALGSLVFDHLGFEMGTMLMTIVMMFTVFVIGIYFVTSRGASYKKLKVEPDDVGTEEATMLLNGEL